MYRLESYDGEYEILFQFISNDYLMLSVSREFAFKGKLDDPHFKLSPEDFGFVGILHGVERKRRLWAGEEEDD